MEKISSYQLFACMVLFQVGSTIVFGFASGAGRDAWVAVLCSTFAGVIVLWLYTTLMKWQPGTTLVQWFPQQFGKWIGTPIAWLYPLAFLYVAGRVLRDFSELLKGTILLNTPNWVICVSFLIVVTFGVAQGLETLARTAEFLFPVALLLYFIEIFLLISSSIVQPEQILPVLEDGWQTIWKTVWPTDVTVPFGESIVFAMFWTKLNHPRKIRPLVMGATVAYGLLLLSADMLAVMVLGEHLFEHSLYPLYELVKQIEASEFVENLDPILVLHICIMVFLKINMFMLGAVDGIEQLVAWPGRRRRLVYPAAGLVLLFALTMAKNVDEHMLAGLKVVPRMLWIPLFLLLPLLLFVVTWARRNIRARHGSDVSES